MKSIKSQITLSLYRSFFQRKVEHRQHTSNWSYNWRSISPRCKAHVWYQFLTKYWVSYAIHLFHYVICKEGALSKCGLPLLVRIWIEIANHSYLKSTSFVSVIFEAFLLHCNFVQFVCAKKLFQHFKKSKILVSVYHKDESKKQSIF